MTHYPQEQHVTEETLKSGERRNSALKASSVSTPVAVSSPGAASDSVPRQTPSSASISVHGDVQGPNRDTVPKASPGSVPGSVPGSAPRSVPGSAPGSVPGSAPVSVSGSAPGSVPGSAPGSVPSSAPVSVSGSAPGSVPGSAPGSVPASVPGSAQVSAPGSGPGSGCVTRPCSDGSLGLQQEGYSVVTAAVFMASAAVGANLLNVPEGIANLGWLGVPILAAMGFQSWFCSHLLASCWMLVQSQDPALSGVVHQPYPLMAERALGRWARHLTSVAVLGVDTLTSVMLLVLASDLVASIFSYTFPSAQPTVCLLILLMATFLCPFTWFESPKNFWLVAVLGLSTSVSAWLLLLMKMCADFSHRPRPPARLQPPPLRVMLGMSSMSNCFATGALQPTIQADMSDRSTFTASVTAVFVVVALMVSSTAATGYTLLGSEAKSSVLHNLAPGRLLLAIQGLMLLHVLSSFIIYLNPLYQEMEEKLGIPEGGWRQYSFRTFCMCLMVLTSEALPDFSHVLSLISVLAVLLTTVVPPIMYLQLTSKAGGDVKLNRTEKIFLLLLVVTGVVYGVVCAFGTTSYVFVEQKQGSCFRSLSSSKSPEVKSVPATTPASRAIIFKAQILTFKPPTA